MRHFQFLEIDQWERDKLNNYLDNHVAPISLEEFVEAVEAAVANAIALAKEEARQEGYDEGYGVGHADGEEVGYDRGLSDAEEKEE